MKPFISKEAVRLFHPWRLGHKFIWPINDPSLTLAERIIEAVLEAKATSMLDICSGTGAVSYVSKRAGLVTSAVDVGPSAVVLLKALIENNSIVLEDGAIEALFDTSSMKHRGRFEKLYGSILGIPNASALDALASNLPMLDSEMQKTIAIASVVAALGHMVKQQHYHVRSDKQGFCGAPNIKESNLADACKKWLKDVHPKLLVNGPACRAYEMDAIKAAKTLMAEAVVADVPYGGTATGYTSAHAIPDNIVKLLTEILSNVVDGNLMSASC